MLDTNIFNIVVNQNISLPQKKDYKYFSTEVQYIEINKTKNKDRREFLLNTFNLINPEIINSETALWGEFSWGERKFGYVSSDFIKIKEILDTLEYKKNNKEDALIAEITIKYGFILITNDSNLRESLKRINKLALSFEEFLVK
jgi:rRNA-processing protein FCF1